MDDNQSSASSHEAHVPSGAPEPTGTAPEVHNPHPNDLDSRKSSATATISPQSIGDTASEWSRLSQSATPASATAPNQQSTAKVTGRLIPFPIRSGAPAHESRPPSAKAAEPIRRGKSMSRRRGQKGYLEKSGNWWVVRWWMDVPGQEKRSHRRAKVCPISGPGKLTQSERQRRASEIIAESGADTVEYFGKVVTPEQPKYCVTFKEQGEAWFAAQKARKRKPVAPGTLQVWRCTLDKWLYPHLGNVPLSAVSNSTVKPLVAVMSGSGLSPGTITNKVQVVKAIVASAKDKEGEELYPRKWSPEFMDIPVVDKATQNTPTFSSEIMSGLVRLLSGDPQMFAILGGATGFRISEGLGIEINKHISADFRTITIEQQAIDGKVQDRLKTANAYREIDLHPSVAALLKEFVGERRSGFLFQSRTGTPLRHGSIVEQLHRALKELGYINHVKGCHKAGSHAFRRFRNTYLKNVARCPSGLLKFWLGHAQTDMSDLYDKIKYNVEFRRESAEKCGIGFELPPRIVPKVPKLESLSGRFASGEVAAD